MNHIEGLQLKNTYLEQRHGKSKANRKNIINSDPTIGRRKYGLTLWGKFEVAWKVHQARKSGPLKDVNPEDIIILSTEFRRGRQTSRLTRRVLRVKTPIELSQELNERIFGDKLEGKSSKNYPDVWERDKKNPERNTDLGIQSMDDVVDEATGLITHLEEQYSGKVIILVTHGDRGQGLETAFRGMSPADHRSLPPLKTGEIRELTQS
jgi:probable phosphoglycerate mutase